MTFYLYEDDVRKEEYAAESVLGVLDRIAELYEPGSAERRFAGDLIVYDETRWQGLLDEYRDDNEDPDALPTFLESAGAPEHLPEGQLLLYLSAFPLEGPSERDAKDVVRFISSTPSAQEIERVFDEVLPDFGYRIQAGIL